MVLAYVDKIAKDNNNVKYLLVPQDRLDRTVDAKGLKTKDSKETVCAFLAIITKKNRPKKIGSTREQSLLESFELCKAEGMQTYSTISETKPAFTELTIRFWRIDFTGIAQWKLHGSFFILVHSQFVSNSSQP